ncbi:MAG: alpha-glucan family phosphorylase [Chloroflexota bacterium]|nr:alpha-glucan family phosphorylase [Chloroflexota bacterium]
MAYFCAEYGLAAWLPIYSGGLGVLAGDALKEASDMELPLVGVGLFYRHGFFRQWLDEAGYQHEAYATLDPAHLPLSPMLNGDGRPLLVPVPIADRTVYVRIWALQVGRTPLYLLDTDVANNEWEEDRAITANLYGGDQETRIKQEIVLGIGGVRALRAMGITPSIYSMNEGHAAFLALELLAERLKGDTLSNVLTEIRSRIVYTNHTVVPAGNDVFTRDLVEMYLGPYSEMAGIGLSRLLELGGSGEFSMALLAFQVSGRANAVSELHGAIIPQHWPGYEINVVTNGVHVPSWLGPVMREVLDRHLPGWRSDEPHWDRIRQIPIAELWEARNAQRREMVTFVNQRQSAARLDGEVLTLVWARRFAEYKRAGLLAGDLERLARLLSNPRRPMQLIISGKAHPRDEGGKRALQELLYRLRSDARTASRVAFVENYDLEVARYLTMGADVWLNTPRKPLEASGTSGMKSSDNGGLQLTVRDGWAAEVDWWNVGWGIEGRDDTTDAEQLHTFLEGDIVNSFYDRDDRGIPRRWTDLMKNTMLVTLSRYSARRMMLDYLNKLYLPLLDEQTVTGGVASN